MRRSLLAVLVLVCVVATGMAQQAPSEQPLLQADRDFNKATQENRLEGWMRFMADNVVIQQGNAVGKAAVRATLEKQWNNPNFKLTWEPTRGEMFPSGTFGYTTGRWTLIDVDEQGKPMTLHGNYLTVWKKQADGSWRVIWDGGSSDPQPKQ